MMQLRKSSERGRADHGWLKSWHSFSFASYYDPAHMGFRSLRVINEDRIKNGTGFGTHPHRDMEIITYVVKGGLEHQDSMGNKSVIVPGEVQRMSAGRGVFHSEHAVGDGDETHLFQIWILPRTPGGEPGYGQKSFAAEIAEKKLALVVSGDGRDGSIGIHQDADLYVSRLGGGEGVGFRLRPGRGAWVQVVKGALTVNGRQVAHGDALSFENGESLSFAASEESEFLLFDLA